MAVNLASTYSAKVAERFRLSSLTDAIVNHEYEFTGAQTISALTVTAPTINDYSRTGTSRYGTPAELQDTKQDLTLSKDRSFSFTIDQGNYLQQQMVKKSGKMLRMTIEEKIVPEIDKRRMAVIATAAEAASQTTGTAAAITSSNAYAKFLAATEKLNDAGVPLDKRVALMKASYYTLLKQDSSFIKASDLAQELLIKGMVGMVDGVKVVVVPASYFPADVALIMGHPSAVVSAEQLREYKTHENPPGINGWLVEGRVIYDAFVLDAKNTGVVIHKTA